MVNIFKTVTLVALGIIIILTGLSCGGGITQEEYDSLQNKITETETELEAVHLQLSELQNEPAPEPEEEVTPDIDLKKLNDANLQEIETLKGQLVDLTGSFTELQEQNEANLDELAEIEQQYAELQIQYADVVAGPGPFTTADVEQAIFDLINQTRTDNGLEALLPGQYIHDNAEANNQAMIEAREITYSLEAGWQEIFWATGYDTADAIANAVLTTWKNNIIRFNTSVLNPQAIYGAVSVYKSGDIIYITYISHTFQ